MTALGPQLVPPAGTAPAAEPAVKRTLRNHVDAVEFIAATIEQLDDTELSEDQRDELSRLLIAELTGTRSKVDAVCGALAMFEHLAAAAVAERDRLARRALAFAARAERLEQYVLAVLDASRLDKLEGETSTLARRRNPPKVVIDDAMEIPIDFLRFPPELPPPDAEPDKPAIRAALLADPASVPGAHLTQGYRLDRS